jgi:hypothetical protein
VRRYLLYIGSIVDVLFTVLGAPAIALNYVLPTLRLNPIIWVPFLVCILIWLFCTGYWGMEKISDAYRVFNGIRPAR